TQLSALYLPNGLSYQIDFSNDGSSTQAENSFQTILPSHYHESHPEMASRNHVIQFLIAHLSNDVIRELIAKDLEKYFMMFIHNQWDMDAEIYFPDEIKQKFKLWKDCVPKDISHGFETPHRVF